MNNTIQFDFLTAGNAIFTVSNSEGKHYTYRIRKPKPDAPYFVQVLTGPDNTGDYTYMGIFNPQPTEPSQILKLTQKSKMNSDSIPVRVFRWAATLLKNNMPLPEGYAIQHEGRCCRCGRTLTVPESIEDGIGPECKASREGRREL